MIIHNLKKIKGEIRGIVERLESLLVIANPSLINGVTTVDPGHLTLHHYGSLQMLACSLLLFSAPGADGQKVPAAGIR